MTTTHGLWNMSFGKIGATLKALEDRGVTAEHLKRLRTDAAFADRVAFELRNDRYADEQVLSTRAYVCASKSLADQVDIVRQHFPSLNSDFSPATKAVPRGAESLFAIPRWQLIGRTYGDALQKVLDVFGKMYGSRFKYGEWGVRQLAPIRQSERSQACWKQLAEEQSGFDFLIVPAQFGLRYRGMSSRRALDVMRPNEFGLGAFAVGIMLLTHEQRWSRDEDLWADCAGDEIENQNDRDRFSRVPYFRRDHGERAYAAGHGGASPHSGTASGFVEPIQDR